MDQKFAHDVLRYVEATSTLTDRLLDRERTFASQEKEASDRRPAMLEQLVKTGSIRPDQRAIADNMLRSTGGTFELLGLALTKIASLQEDVAKVAAELGRPSGIKQAGAAGAPVQQSTLRTGVKTVEPPASYAILDAILEDPR